MNFDFEEKEEVVVIKGQGYLNMYLPNSPLLDDIKEWIEEGKLNFVFDCSEIDLINSSGLSMLLSILTLSRNAGGDMILAAIPERISKLLIITKLHAIFPTYPTVDEAVEALKVQL